MTSVRLERAIKSVPFQACLNIPIQPDSITRIGFVWNDESNYGN